MSQAWRNPAAWNRAAAKIGERRLIRVPRSDWLDPEVPVEWLARFLRMIHDTPNLTWTLLTKRPADWKMSIRRVLLWHHSRNELNPFLRLWINGHPPANVWVGTSVENQSQAAERIPALLGIPAVGRFLSMEPLLGPVDLSPMIVGEGSILHVASGSRMLGIGWVIISGESGPSARPCNVDWIRSLVRQCDAAGVPCFVQQLGARPVCGCVPAGHTVGSSCVYCFPFPLRHPKGGNPAEWPEDIRVRQFPEGLR